MSEEVLPSFVMFKLSLFLRRRGERGAGGEGGGGCKMYTYRQGTEMKFLLDYYACPYTVFKKAGIQENSVFSCTIYFFFFNNVKSSSS